MDHNRNNNVEFLPGFSFCAGTRPGKTITREKFSVCFHGVLVSGQKTMISQGFQCCYDWSPIMDIFLDAFDEASNAKVLEDLEKIEDLIKEELSSWFLTYPGWGLFSSLLPRETQLKLTRSLQEVQRSLRQVGKEHSDQTCWKVVTRDFNSPMADLLPYMDVTLMEGDFGGEAGRSKGLVLRLEGKWNLDIQFVVDKPRKSRATLLDASLDAVARNMRNDLSRFEIPASLYAPLSEAWQDARWLSTAQWNFKI